MKPASRFSVVLVTAPDINVARKLAHGALGEKLAACANLIPKIESHYWWKGKIESDAEVLCIFKTTKSKLKAFQAFVRKNHPYDTPEIVALPITHGSEPYMKWLQGSVGKK
jgi:periplasmic divalent cation tolerance protein